MVVGEPLEQCLEHRTCHHLDGCVDARAIGTHELRQCVQIFVVVQSNDVAKKTLCHNDVDEDVERSESVPLHHVRASDAHTDAHARAFARAPRYSRSRLPCSPS